MSIWKDNHGLLRLPWVFSSIGAIVIVILVVGCILMKVVNEAACNRTAAHYSTEGDYGFWEDRCWLIARDGRPVSEEAYRATERVRLR